MLKMSLKKKILAGYSGMIVLMIIVGGISLIQFKSLATRVRFLTQDVAEKVRQASEIETAILSMRVSVEKFIYLNKEKDNLQAEENITIVKETMERAKKQIKSPQEVKILNTIGELTRDYIEKYRKAVIRYNVRNKSKLSLSTMNEKIQENLESLSDTSENAGELALISFNMSKEFMQARVWMEKYLANYSPVHAKKAITILGKILENLETVNLKQFEPIIFAVEDCMDAFEGLVSISNKLDGEIQKTVLPIASQVVDLSKKISSSGWGEMNQSGIDVEKNVDSAVTSIVLIIFFSIVLGLFVGLISAKQIIKPIIKVVDGLKDIVQGEGDLTARLDINSKDEVGELAKWFNSFVENNQKMIKEITLTAQSLKSSASDLSSVSGEMTSGAEEMSSRSENVSKAAGDMSSNMNAVAAATEQASTNVGIIATSAGDMTSTVDEIAQNSEKGRAITGDAVSQARDASDRVDELGLAAREVGKVTETITEISEQINLLALNATIEAARAGDAGKGFAVVANEIKELAKQTAEATGEIKRRINDIQGSTEGTVKQIEEISKVINNVNDIVSTIASAVEEQSSTSKEVSDNVHQASLGITEITENVSQSSIVAGEIAQDISEVNQASSEMSNSSNQINGSAQELNKLAVRLNDIVGRFKV